MKRPPDRRTVLMTVGAAALATTAGTTAAQSTDIHGEISLKGGLVIPEGLIEVYLEDMSIPDSTRRRVAATRVTSSGGSEAIGFSLANPTIDTASRKLRIVARLERPDGWLIARGSARFKAEAPVIITMAEALY